MLAFLFILGERFFHLCHRPFCRISRGHASMFISTFFVLFVNSMFGLSCGVHYQLAKASAFGRVRTFHFVTYSIYTMTQVNAFTARRHLCIDSEEEKHQTTADDCAGLTM